MQRSKGSEHQEHQERQRRSAQDLEQRLLLALQGATPRAPAELPPEFAEAMAAQEPWTAAIVDHFAHAPSIEERVAAALASEVKPLPLADGSTMAFNKAQRRLVEKEDRVPFPPLRDLLEDRAALALPVVFSQRFLQLQAETEQAASPRALAPEDVRVANAVLAQTEALWVPALEVLASYSGHPADHGHRLARAIDAAHVSFTFEGAQTALRPLRDRSRALAQRPAQRVRAPNAFQGQALLQSAEHPRWLMHESWRAQGFLALLRGGATVLLNALGPAPHNDEDDRAWRALGTAAAISMMVLRPLSRSEQARVDRLLRAILLLSMRARAAMVLSWSTDGAEPEAWKAHLDEHLGGFCPLFLRWGFQAQWPGYLHTRGPGAALALEIAELLHGVRLHCFFRDLFDEAWASHPDFLRTLAASEGAQRALLTLDAPLWPGAGADGVDDLFAARDWFSEMV